MKIYLDTEFIDTGTEVSLISIALVKENNEEYYAVSSEFEEEKASDWVKGNVLSQLEPPSTYKPLSVIREEIVTFIGYQIPEIWAYFATFDWLLVLRLYGGLGKLPYNFPLYCHELCQEIDRIKLPSEDFPERNKQHHALTDARWIKDLHQKTQKFKEIQS
jgi:hypothetical protein